MSISTISMISTTSTIITIFVLFPHDLYRDISYIKDSKVYLVEEEKFFNRSDKVYGGYKLNILKPVYHRATMKAYFDYLKSKKIDCEYINLTDDWVKVIKASIKKKENTRLCFFDPTDSYIEKKISYAFEEYDILDTPRFILTTDDMKTYTGALRQTSFYSWMRTTQNILMDGKKPIGGKLTYDMDNRLKPYASIEDDVDDYNEYSANTNAYVKEAQKYISKTIKESDLVICSDQVLKFPIDYNGAVKRVRDFVKYNLFEFGHYQDAMIDSKDNSFVFHSGISPMLNIGLITPEEVIDIVLGLSKQTIKKHINDVEGFIRQIVGWREFSRYMYEYHGDKYRNKNFFNATKVLTKTWYPKSNMNKTGDTMGIYPLDVCIEKAFRYGYLHHIERLMIVANYMTLAGISPKQMHRWFTEFALDSYDWVMDYNIYCMASYSDGGHFTSKPYISTSKYVLKMSTYKNDKWCNEWDNMFWNFIKKHKSKIKKIGRLASLVKYI